LTCEQSVTHNKTATVQNLKLNMGSIRCKQWQAAATSSGE
jgi:hypothetical protein